MPDNGDDNTMSIFRKNATCSATAVTAFAVTAILSAAPVFADAGHAHSKIGAPAKAKSATRTVAITLGDNFFEPKTIKVRPGETVRFVLSNKGELLHEFNLGTAAMHAAHQKEMMTMMEHGMMTPTGMNSGMMNMEHGKSGMADMKHDDPNSVLVEPGRTKELTWKFGEPMTLEFTCNIPGHYESGMVGKVMFGK